MQTVKLTSRREVAPAVYELLFTRPEGWTFEAGQFARIGLAADGDEPVFRAYSIAGSPQAEGLRFLVKSVEGGALPACAPSIRATKSCSTAKPRGTFSPPAFRAATRSGCSRRAPALRPSSP